MPPLVSTTTASVSHPDLTKPPPPQALSVGGFDQHGETLHGVEFKAPFSSESQKPPLTQERFSIDFSIELERQLERMEDSPLSSPPLVVGTHGNMDATKSATGNRDKELLDPEILAHIITQLRQSLSEMTKERDELVKMLAHANEEEANVKDALQLMTEKATQAEEELGEAKKRLKEDEEQIALLRAKVEESRRGLMRLQTENRRQSMSPLDISRASSMLTNLNLNPPSSKRASFTPLTGSRHGRKPSFSDSNHLLSSDHNSPPNTHSSFGDAGLSPSPPSGSRGFSGLIGRVSPGIPDNESNDPQPPQAEIETLKAEVKSLKNELESVKHELAEVTEAKEASDTCVKALREFIAENDTGVMEVNLPPPPSMVRAQDAAVAEPKKTGSGWGFKLWGSGSSMSLGTPMVNDGVSDPHDSAIPPPISPVPSGACGVPPTPATTVSTEPLTRKLTGLFSSRSSISSRVSATQTKLRLGNAGSPPLIDRTNSTCSYSDVSSLVGPMSPVMMCDDVNGRVELGEVKPFGEDKVGDVTNLDLVEKEQETPPLSLHEVDLDSGLR